MAYVGMKYCFAARIMSETPGQEVGYGEGIEVGRAISAEISYTRNSDPLYANDAIAESDNSITGGTITISVDDVSDEARQVILSETAIEQGSAQEYEENGDPSPYIGFGYMRVRQHRNQTSYVCYLVHKTQLGISSESAATKTGSISWQTPTLTGPMMAVNNTEDMKNNFRRRATFENEAAGLAWLKGKLNVSDSLTPTAMD